MKHERSSTLKLVLACLVAIVIVPLVLVGGGIVIFGTSVQSTQFNDVAAELSSAPTATVESVLDVEPSGAGTQQRTNELRMVAWNVESDGNDPQVISQQLGDFAGYDVIALNEVAPRSIEVYKESLGPYYTWRTSESGGADRLTIGFSNVRFEEVHTRELTDHKGIKLNDGNHRSPLFVHLKERDSSLTFIVMTNHLARRKEEVRQEQAAGLREWWRDQTVPVIAIGDFNFDYDFETEKGNESFAVFMRDGVWKWIKPDPLIDTNWSDNGEGGDTYPHSMLDFAFVAQGAKDWDAECSVIVREGDFPDDETTSDHRATELVVQLSETGQ